MVVIGVLAVQGAFSEHINAFKRALSEPEFAGKDIELKEVRSADDILQDMVGIVLPGGESTAAGRVLSRDNFGEKLKDFAYGKLSTKPPAIWGTCSGLIMLANDLENQKVGGQYHIGGLDVTVSRNFFGRQINSFETEVDLTGHLANKSTCYGVFIRAPAVVKCNSDQVQILATISLPEKSSTPIVVGVQQNNILATSFHPELTEDLTWHKHFLRSVSA